MATEEIQISELELAEEVLADMLTVVETSTDTKAITLKQLKSYLGSSLPTGFILPAVGRINDERFTLLDGKTLSRSGTYEAFCNKVIEKVQDGEWFSCTEEEFNQDVSNYGQCGRFVIGNDYIRIPKITRYIGATITLSEIGKTYAESLPKPSATVRVNSSTISQDYGLNGDRFVTNGQTTNTNTTSLFATTSTYQDGAKVNPEHTKFPYYMVVSTEGQNEDISIDINQVYEDLELKANKDLSNIDANSTAKENIVGWAIPDYSAGISRTSGTQYTADTNGYIMAQCFHNAPSGGTYITCVINGVEIPFKPNATDYGRSQIYLPIKKGDIYTITANNNIYFFPYRE